MLVYPRWERLWDVHWFVGGVPLVLASLSKLLHIVDAGLVANNVISYFPLKTEEITNNNWKPTLEVNFASIILNLCLTAQLAFVY